MSAVSRTGFVRRLVEIALGPFVVRRKLPREAGAGLIAVSARVGGLKYLFKRALHWDPELLNVAAILVKDGQYVWDVGANVGLFSRAAAFHAGSNGQVLSIEADIDAVMLLNKTVKYNSPSHSKITVLPVAVSDSVGIVSFAIAKRARAANSIEGHGSTQTGGVREVRTLPCTTLDSLLQNITAPDVLKIDVEGAELRVLNGAGNVLQNIRPVIYCEVAENNKAEVTRLFASNGYRLWNGDSFYGTSFPEIANAARNTVAIPNEKVEDFDHRKI